MSFFGSIFSREEFFDRDKLVKKAKSKYGISIEPSRTLLIYQSPTQKTYIAKTTDDSYIINDNLGRIVLASRRPANSIRIDSIQDGDGIYKVKIPGIRNLISVSKSLFYDKSELAKKINDL